MGHCVMQDIINGKKTKQEISDKVLTKVRNSGDGYGTNKIQFPTEKIFDTEQMALDYIDEIDTDFYGGYAVRFYDYTNVKPSAKIEELRKKIVENHVKKNEYIAEHSVRKQKAAYIGCQECGSKLNKLKLKGEHCPLCFADLRSATVLNRIAGFDKKKEDLCNKIEVEQVKYKNKADVNWLVKYEYHC